MGKQPNAGSTWQLWGVVIIVQLFWCHLGALDPFKTVDQYLVDQWEIFDGIPSNTVLSINQTPDGYLWIGTSKGLVRFDGMKFVIVRFAEKEEIYSQEIRHLFVDREGILWIGSSGGLISYRYQSGQFKIFAKDDGITGDGIRRINDDLNGNIWISFTASYANRLSNGEFTVFNASQGLLGKKINAFVKDVQGNLLCGTRENGIFFYKDEKFYQYSVSDLKNVLIITMHMDSAGDLWIGTDIGLFRINPANVNTKANKVRRYTTADGLSNDWITSITEDSEGNLWVGTQKGLNRLQKKPDTSVSFDGILNTITIMWLFEDREKSLWIGTDNSGIKRLKDSKFVPYFPFETYPEEVPISLFEDRNGDTWIGTFSGTLFCCQGDKLIKSAVISEPSGKGIAAIAQDRGGNLWLGTIGKGIFQKKKDRLIRYTTQAGLADSVVTSIYRDSQGNLWFSTFDGVSVLRFYDGVIESLKSGDGLSGKVVHNVYESRGGDILIAADKGITILPNLLTGGTDSAVGLKGGSFFKMGNRSLKVILPGISVTCLYEDPAVPEAEKSIYWIATDGTGLKRLNIKDGTITSYTTADGMTTNFIYQFFEDKQGYFWLMSNSGILRVNKHELNRFASGNTEKINCISYGISDGMKSLEFDNQFSRNSALKANNGEFRFITKKGISIVNSEKIRFNKTPPPVVIESLYFDQQALTLHPDSGPVILNGITKLSIRFAAPTFLSPEKTKFKYRLEGIDREWIFLLPGQERAAYYTDLAPGNYTFRVTACNAEGVWNQTGDSFIFILKSSFFQMMLFKITALVLLVILVLVAVFFIYKKKKYSFEKKARYKSSTLEPSFAEACITKLKYLMEIEKLFRDAEISLQSLAEKMSIAPHVLSQLLNEKLDRNFSDFINFYRIEEAKKILQSVRGARRKISAVAVEVGFNTMAAFYKAFKKYTDMTPTRYKKKIRNKK